MQKLNLEPKNKEQELVKAYLQENASDILAEKINNGVIIEKDGKRLINRKNLDGFMKYACDEARKQAEKGKNSACVQAGVVYGWAVHYFEENDIEGELFNEDGTEYKPAPAPKQTVSANPVTPPKPQPKPQMSLFDLMNGPEKPAASGKETPKAEIQPDAGDEDDEISEEEQREILAELATEEERRAKEQRQKPAGSPIYRQYPDIQAKYPDSIVIYRLGDFYEVFGDNAKLLAEELDLTLTGRDCGLDEHVPMVGFPYHVSDAYFDKIARNGHSVVLIENDSIRELPSAQNVDLETGEILSEAEMRLFDGDVEEPDFADDEPDIDLSAFDTGALAALDEMFGSEITLR